ncbi:MAG TPA: hypothetical protein VFK05_14745 [Polyangiaceae bacterium]|nr:hypothetical protein [Polyangiaceae bacterium]
MAVPVPVAMLVPMPMPALMGAAMAVGIGGMQTAHLESKAANPRPEKTSANYPRFNGILTGIDT